MIELLRSILLPDAIKLIAEEDPEINVHLGTKDGSSFIDIAPASEMAQPHYLERLSNMRLARYKRWVRRYESGLQTQLCHKWYESDLQTQLCHK